MSKLYIGHNQNARKSKAYLLFAILLAIPLVIYIYLFFVYRFHFNGIGHLLPMFIFGFPSSILFSKYHMLQSGLDGEAQTINCLKLLDDSYTVFTNVPISSEGKETEIDTLVIGRNGVFVIEVKNHNGIIEGAENENVWVQHKVGRKGGEYQKSMKNPIKQVRFQVFMLSKLLRSNNMNVWIEDIVYFSNRQAGSRVAAQKVFFDSDDLLNYIQSHKPSRQLGDNEINNIVNILKSIS